MDSNFVPLNLHDLIHEIWSLSLFWILLSVLIVFFFWECLQMIRGSRFLI